MREEISKIIAKAEDFYDDAVYLFKGDRYGAVVNRSYYAMFTLIQGLLISENVFSKTHQGTMGKFHEPIDLLKADDSLSNSEKMLNRNVRKKAVWRL